VLVIDGGREGATCEERKGRNSMVTKNSRNSCNYEWKGGDYVLPMIIEKPPFSDRREKEN